MRKYSLQLISKLGEKHDKALLIRLSDDVLAKVQISDNGDIDPIDFARILLASEEDEEFSQLENQVKLMRLIYDPSIAVEK